MSIYESMIELPEQSPILHFLTRYCKIVQAFIDRDLKKQKGFHSHHIIPKALGGSELKENKVVVTSKEHFVLHWILSEAFPESAMTTAFSGMCNEWKHYGFRVTSRVFEKAMFKAAERHSRLMKERTLLGLNPLSKRADGTSVGQKATLLRILSGTFVSPFLKRSDGTSVGQEITQSRIIAGTFINPFSTREDGTNVQTDRVMARTHHLLKREDGTSVGGYSNLARITARTHNFLGSEYNQKRLENGTHPSQIKVKCDHCGKECSKHNYIRWHGDKCKLNLSQSCPDLTSSFK